MANTIKDTQPLVNYGIHNEKSSLRIHVCPAAKAVYVYQTKKVLEVLQTKTFREVPVFVGGMQTAKGYLVPPGEIPGLQKINVEDRLWDKFGVSEKDSTSLKGKRAEQLVQCLIRKEMIWLPATRSARVTNLQEQYDGVDLNINSDHRAQVKCDWRGGDQHQGTGNLFIQTAERNASKSY